MVTQEIMTVLFDAISCGSTTMVLGLLFNMTEDEKREVLETLQDEIYGEKSTPLFYAVKKKQRTIVKALVRNFKFNMEVLCTMEIDGLIIHGVTALWAAAAFGQFEVIQHLVESGANVNSFSQARSTPLRAACYDGKLDIVKYLVENGANINLPNIHNNTCLMVACNRGFKDIVSFLLDNGADCNFRAHCGASALLFAAEKGCSNIIATLVAYGAENFSTYDGMTPLLAAAERCHKNVILILMKLFNISKEEEIDAYELAGATFANDSEHYNPDMSIQLWKHAMALRNSMGPSMRKKLPPPIPAYDNREECRNMADITAIQDNLHAIHMESLTIRERILGPCYRNLLHCIIYRGAVLAEETEFDKCLQLWFHALKISRACFLPIMKDLTRFCRVLTMMLELGLTVEYSHLKFLFEYTLVDLERAINFRKLQIMALKGAPLLKDELEISYQVILLLISVFCAASQHLNEEQQFTIKKIIHSIIKAKAEGYLGLTMLHMSLCAIKGPESSDPLNISSFPSPRLTKLLIECGDNVNAMTQLRDTPLHIALNDSTPGFDIIYDAVSDLLKAGAHIDVVNVFGRTPLETAAPGNAREVITQFLQEQPLSLKCLAARSWKQSKAAFEPSLPAELKDFVNLHGKC